MQTKKWMTSLALGTALLGPTLTVNAQYVQNAITTPIAPGCGPGESWTKDGVRYQCETPQPSCQYGFASGPVWTGSSWSYSCNAPPTPPQTSPTAPVTQDANSNCITASAAAGYTITGGFQTLNNPTNMLGCSTALCLIYPATGPTVRDGTQCDNTTYLYDVYCAVNPNNTVYSIGVATVLEYGCGGQGG